MIETGDSLLRAVALAKEAERKAEEFYRSAARRTVNPLGHRLLRQLAGFEREHYERLAAVERSLARQGADASSALGSSAPSLSEAGSALGDCPSGAKGILTMALHIEELAQQRYDRLAERAGNPAGREIFSRLADEKHQHYLALTKAASSLDRHGVWDWSASSA